jgi:hypothetical protein
VQRLGLVPACLLLPGLLAMSPQTTGLVSHAE